jgi:hypothetical protein
MLLPRRMCKEAATTVPVAGEDYEDIQPRHGPAIVLTMRLLLPVFGPYRKN